MIEPTPADNSPGLPVPRVGFGGQVAPMESMPFAGGRGGGYQEDDGAQTLKRYLAAVLRAKWMIAAMGVLGLAGGWAASKFFSSQYETQATVWIEDSQDSDLVGAGQLLQSQSWIDLLKSYLVLDEAVRRLKLYVNTPSPADSALFTNLELGERFATGAFVLSVDEAGQSVAILMEGSIVDRVGIGDSLGLDLGFLWVPAAQELTPGREAGFSVVNPRTASIGLANAIQADIDRNASFLSLRLAGPNPVRITNTLNIVVERFEEVAAELKREKLTQRVQILREQLADAGRNLRTAEDNLERFRIEAITLPSDQPMVAGLEMARDPVIANYFRLRVLADGLRRDRAAISRVLEQVGESKLRAGALEAIESVRSSSELMSALAELATKTGELRVLRRRYTDAAPLVARLVDDVDNLELEAIPGLALALIRELDARENEIETQLVSASAELQDIPPRMIREGRLVRDVEISDDLFSMLQRNFGEARLSEASSIPDVRILDRAVVPQWPISARGPVTILMGLVGGIGLGLVGAVLRDRIDRRVRYPSEITEQMGLSILGVIPHLKGAKSGGRVKSSAIIEALRGVRMNVVHAYGSAGPLVLTVSSPGSGDGKSFVSSNLALAFADAGQRTLLIDGDSRRGALHRVFGVPRKPGLTDALAEPAQSDGIVHKTEYAHLEFVACGTRMSGAPELFSSPAMVQFVTGLRADYDVIILDSPPLGAGIDAFALATVTGNLIMVLRTGRTNREDAEARLNVLDRLPVRVLGAILNDARDAQAHGYYGYYSYYLPGYDAETEDEEVAKVIGASTE